MNVPRETASFVLRDFTRFLPADRNLIGAEVELVDSEGREQR